MRLFGRCQFEGNCICGRCANAAVNQKSEIVVTSADGSTRTEQIAQAEPAKPLGSVWNHGAKRKYQSPAAKQNRKRCPDCNVFLRVDHKCKGGAGKNGPILTTRPCGCFYLGEKQTRWCNVEHLSPGAAPIHKKTQETVNSKDPITVTPEGEATLPSKDSSDSQSRETLELPDREVVIKLEGIEIIIRRQK